jgi:hypothetical protein
LLIFDFDLFGNFLFEDLNGGPRVLLETSHLNDLFLREFGFILVGLGFGLGHVDFEATS